MSDFLREDAVDDFLNNEAINYQLRKAGRDVIADDGSDIDRIACNKELPDFIPARDDHLTQPTDVELHAYDHDEPEYWPYDCGPAPCDMEDMGDEIEDEDDDDDTIDFDVEDLFDDLEDIEVDEIEDETNDDDEVITYSYGDDDEEDDDEDYY